jgi:hypothetical protein
MGKWRYCSLINFSTVVGEWLASCFGSFTPRNAFLVPVEVESWAKRQRILWKREKSVTAVQN